MKNLMFLVALLIAVPFAQAQKQEIKKAQQAVNSGNLDRAATYLLQAKQIFAAADENTRAMYYVVEAEMKIASSEMTLEQLESISQSLSIAKKYNSEKTLSERIHKLELSLNGLSSRVAAGEFKKKNFSQAATLFNVAYQSSRDTLHLFKAAQSHLLAKEHEEAFAMFRKLFNMGFTDAKIRYVATNVETGKKEAFASESVRKVALKQRTHKKPEIVRSSSKLPVLLRGITVSSIEINKKNEAVSIFDKALSNAPGDKKLLNQVFRCYLQLDAKDRYQAIMDGLIKEEPNDPSLHYNLGVASAKNNDIERAMFLYKKALELDPYHINTKQNLTLLLLDQEKGIVEQMNSLGSSNEDDQQYQALKTKRINLYDEMLPFLKSLATAQPQNTAWTEQLKNIHLYKSQDDKKITAEEKIDD